VEIILVQSSSIIFDPITTKILKSLNKKYSTLGLGWNREGLSKKITDNFIVGLNLLILKPLTVENH